MHPPIPLYSYDDCETFLSSTKSNLSKMTKCCYMVHHTYPKSFIIVCIISKVLFSVTSKTLIFQFLHDQIEIVCFCDFSFSNFPYNHDKILKNLFYRVQHQCTWKTKPNKVEFIVPVSNAKQHKGPYSTFPLSVLTVGCIHTYHNFNAYLISHKDCG